MPCLAVTHSSQTEGRSGGGTKGGWEGGGGGGDTVIFGKCLGVECYDLWCQSGAGRGVSAHFQRHPSCGSSSCLRCSFLRQKKNKTPLFTILSASSRFLSLSRPLAGPSGSRPHLLFIGDPRPSPRLSFLPHTHFSRRHSGALNAGTSTHALALAFNAGAASAT